ncbi:hypothetical protein [Cognatishimia sp.]|uniref:hypothetical protein n=1 Tax=Cognatishimia sp. TaxID=2211648 RepID=UPI003519AC56
MSGSPLDPHQWIHAFFASKSAQNGFVVRRKLRDIERFCGLALFLAEVRRRGYRAYENSGQIVVFCNAAPIKRIA